MMDILNTLVKDDDGIVRHYVGAEVGSAYENEDFLPGKVFYNEEELGEVHYRLNAYNDEIELKKTSLDEEKPLALVKNEEVKIVTKNDEIVFRTFIDEKGKSSEGYLSILDKGDNYILYRRVYKKFSEPNKFLKRFSDGNSSILKEYIKTYDFDLENGTDLVKIFQYMEGL